MVNKYSTACSFFFFNELTHSLTHNSTQTDAKSIGALINVRARIEAIISAASLLDKVLIQPEEALFKKRIRLC